MKLYRKINVTEGHKRKDGDARVRGPIYKQTKHLQRNVFLTTQKMFFCSLYFLNILLDKLSSRDEQSLFAKKRVTSLCRCHKFSLDYLFGWLSASTTSFHRTYSSNFLTFLYLLVSNREELHEFGDIISSEFRSRDHSRFRKRRKSKGPDSYNPVYSGPDKFLIGQDFTTVEPVFHETVQILLQIAVLFAVQLARFRGPRVN